MNGETKKNRNGSEKLLEAIGELPEAMVAEVVDPRRLRMLRRKNRRRRFVSVGGSLAAAALFALILWSGYTRGGLWFSGGRAEMTKKDSESAGSGLGEKDEKELGGLGIYIAAAREEKLQMGGDGSGETGDEKNTGQEMMQKSSVSGSEMQDGTDGKGENRMDNNAQRDISSGEGQSIVMLPTSSSEREKNNVTESEMVLGKTGEQSQYDLTASRGISFLTAASLEDTGGKGDRENALGETKKYQCAAGTRVTFSLPVKAKKDSGITDRMPASVRGTWERRGIRAVGYMQIVVKGDTGGRRKGTIYIGIQNGLYYAEFSALE